MIKTQEELLKAIDDPSFDFFITSDTWFGRKQIIDIANRPFSTLNEMNDTLVEKWNEKVSKNDIVFHLGNFAWDPITAENMLSRLNGNIIFCVSDDDDAISLMSEADEAINIIDNDIVILEDRDLVLCHYPLRVWPGKSSGTVHIHGHTVFSHKTNLTEELRINACCDFWNYAPIRFSTLKDLINEQNLSSTSK